MTIKIPFKNVVKRDGRIVPFDKDRIVKAIQKAMSATKEGDLQKDPVRVGERAVKELIKKYPASHTPHIEEIQDVVEESLILMDFPKTAKAYILYRAERAKIREEMRRTLPAEVREKIKESSKHFETPYQEFIFYQFYSRWRDDLDRRETWVETIDRYMDYMKENLGEKLSDKEYSEVREAILNREICPSMRLLWSSGKACRNSNVTAYNCSYIAPRSWRDLSEIMYLSMCGAGVGFSVEPENVEKLPQIKKQTGKKAPKIVVEDSKVGWCEAFVRACTAWEQGYDVEIDYSKVRPAGARLKTMGGRASGPGPLQELMKFTRKKILARQNRRLTTIDLHDIVCQIGLIVVAGGVRRCLPKDTLVHTKEGLKQIQKIVAGQEVLTAKGSYKKVIAAQHTGQRQLFAIRTQLGTFYSTREHRWATLADLEGNIKWVQAKDLTSEDVLLHIPDVLPGRETALPAYTYKKPKHSTTTRDIKIPKLSADIAWLIGYLHGDGYVYRKDETYGELMFACSPDMPETAQRLKRVLEKFGINAKVVSETKNDNTIRVRVKSNQLANYLYQFKQPKKSLIVPDFILEGLPEIRAAYMTGVFDSDGSIKSRNGKKVRPVVAASIYPDWLRQLRAVLASLGVSALIKQNRPAKGLWQPLYQLTTISIDSLNTFGKLMESCGSEKWRNDAKHLDRKKEQCSFVVPRRLLAQSPYRSFFDNAYYAPSSAVSLSVSKFEKELALLNRAPRVVNLALSQYNFQLAAGAYLPVKVFGVQAAHVEETYDIQVEGDERFVAEGMLVHNSALISLSALDDADMRDAKKGTFWQTEGQRSMANNSAVYTTKPTAEEFLDEWTALVKARSGERGIFNRGDLEKQVPKRRWEKLKHAVQPGVNPCVTGDTLVYVADGRGNVPIKQLAEEGRDVPVFCYNKRGQPAVRMMRNPRLTGKHLPVYKMTLEHGSSLRATANHKFLLKNGKYKRVDELSFGDSLNLLTRYEEPVAPHKRPTKDYWWLYKEDPKFRRAEHRLIAAWHYNDGEDIPWGNVVHHRDHNTQNNVPSNLEIMARQGHDRLHGDKMQGDNNPMRRAYKEWDKEKWLEYSQNMSISTTGERNGRFSGITDEELKQHAILLTKQLGRRFSGKDWVKYAKQSNLPQHFSKWRQDHLGGIRGFAKWAAAELGLENIDADPRVIKSYEKYTEQGYDCEMHNNELFIFKQCEVCGDRFITSISAREYGACSISCGVKRAWTDNEFRSKALLGIHAAHDKKRADLRSKQMKVYSDFAFHLGRAPLKKEWQEACKASGISSEISRASSPFRTYTTLQEHAATYNHKVLSVEFAGYEDVYNGTVDEFHNFFVGGFESKMPNGKKKFSYLNNRNCGEIYLQSKEFCNLTSIVVRPKDDLELLKRKMRLATLLGTYQATLTNFEYLSKKWKENCEDEQLLGVSMTGYYDNKIVRQDDVLKVLREEAVETNKKYAKRFGKNPSTAITCVKPHGNSGQLLGVGSGMHPWFSPYFIRRVRISATDPLLKLARDQGIPVRPEVGYSTSNASTMVLEFPIKAPEGAVTVKDVSALDMLKEWKRLKLHFTEHNPSATIYIADNEWVSVANFIYENWDIIGGLSFLPRTDHVYPLAPYQEINEEQYKEMTAQMPDIDFSQLVLYEKEDETVGSKELACAGGVCEVDLALEESGAPSIAPSAAASSS